MNIAPRDFVKTEPKFAETFCSQCGGKFGPGDHGYSHCRDHRKYSRRAKLAQQKDAEIGLRARIHEALEVYAGMEGLPVPTNACEAYLLHVIEEMVQALRGGEE